MDTKKKQPYFMIALNTWVIKHMTRIPALQKIFFVDHLRTMIHAGLSLVEALGVLEKETSNKAFKGIVQEIKAKVEQGQQLSAVLEGYPKIFPAMYVKMIHAGEVAGQLETALEHTVDQMQRSRALTSSIRGAMIYPAVIMTAMGGIGLMMAIVVLPKLVAIFEEFDSALPIATRILIKTTDILSSPLHLTIIIGTSVGLIVGFVMLLKRIPTFRKKIHACNLHIPIIGPIIKQINLAKFSLTLSSLLNSTVQIIEAVDITSSTCTNVLYQDTLKTAATRIQTGTPLSTVLTDHPHLFPPMVTEMLMVGERSGEITTLLHELAVFYSGEVDKTMQNFSKIIEPVIIILIGIAVAGLAVAVIMPMYSLVQSF
jgi:type IV pilus assembly protein PilC